MIDIFATPGRNKIVHYWGTDTVLWISLATDDKEDFGLFLFPHIISTRKSSFSNRNIHGSNFINSVTAQKQRYAYRDGAGVDPPHRALPELDCACVYVYIYIYVCVCVCVYLKNAHSAIYIYSIILVLRTVLRNMVLILAIVIRVVITTFTVELSGGRYKTYIQEHILSEQLAFMGKSRKLF